MTPHAPAARHQATHLARTVSVLIGGAATAVAIGLLYCGRPAFALLAFMATLGVHAWLLAAEFGLMNAVNRRNGEAPAGLKQLTCAWWGECMACTVAFAWRHAWRSGAFADSMGGKTKGDTPTGGLATARPSAPRVGRGVVLVHGLLCNRGFWNGWMRRLSDEGVPYVAVTLEPMLGSIDEYVHLVEAAVATLEHSTGTAPVVVAHSMGGLAVRRWWIEQPAGRLHHLITLGTPHHGTWLGRWAHSANGRQMQINSRWLQALSRREQERTAARGPARSTQALTTCFYSHCDNIVFPARTATLPGASNQHLPGVAHIQMINHPEVHATLRRVLA